MATTNRSISYNRDREKARHWLAHTKEGQLAVENLRRYYKGNLGDFLGDEHEISWDDLVKEQREGLVIAQSAAEQREAFNLARQSGRPFGSPVGTNSAHFVKFFSPPLWYLLRRQVEVNDPNYWNDPLNTLREAMKNEQWATAPISYIRGQLEAMLPKSRPAPLVVSPAAAGSNQGEKDV